MPKINPEPHILDYSEKVRQTALSFPGTGEEFPWGTHTFYRELKGRNFLFLKEHQNKLEVIVRLPFSELEKVRALDFIEISKYTGDKSWATANIQGEKELEIVLPWIGTSYQINKPFRTISDLLPGEDPASIEFLEEVRRVALEYPGIEEYFPFGSRAFRRNKGKIFLYTAEYPDGISLDVLLPLGERDFALSLPFTSIPKYIGSKGWVEARVKTREELETVLPWVSMSYENSLPRPKKQKIPGRK